LGGGAAGRNEGVEEDDAEKTGTASEWMENGVVEGL